MLLQRLRLPLLWLLRPFRGKGLLRLEEEDVVPILKKVIERKMNVSQTEKYIEEFLAKKNPPKRTTKRAFSSVKIFLNTVEGAIKTMQDSGINADVNKQETEDKFIYHITIPKSV